MWRILYSFSEEKFYTRDFQDASSVFSMMPVPRGIFWNNVLCVKNFVLEDDHIGRYVASGMSKNAPNAGIVYRVVMIGNEVKRKIGGKTETIGTSDTELARMQALHDIFGIDLHDDDARHIIGREPAFPEFNRIGSIVYIMF
ncbi:hypothetical protein BDZ97DRAFT_1284584 [Flammula alnicola]|nr:hypothetical protein BDZ97DRAFT_1284584 [Flammula alnicola]